MTTVLIILAALFGALGRRLAGGAFQQWTGLDVGDLPVRIAFAALIVAAAFLGGWHPHALTVLSIVVPPWSMPILLGLGVWIGSTMPMFSSIDLGKAEGTVPLDIAGLTAHGLLGIMLPAALAWWGAYAPLWLLAAGLLSAPAYWLGWTITGVRGAQWLPLGLRGGTEIGETLWGAAVGIGAFLTFA
jgi:hypothetical protein